MSVRAAGMATTVATTLALAGCRGAEATPGPGPTPSAPTASPLASDPTLPDGWRVVPTLEAAVRGAASNAGGADVTVLARAWGDPSAGCYLLALRLAPTAEGTGDAALQRALDGLKLQPGDGPGRFRFGDAHLGGTVVTAVTGSGDGDHRRARIDASACVAADRLPAQCALDCEALRGGLSWAP